MQEPIVTLLVIAVTCVVSYLGFKNFTLERQYIFIPQAILAGKQYYRLVTSAFLHANWTHLIFNMLSLYLFGRNLEFFLGPAQFLLIYLGSIIGGDLISLYVHRHHDYSSYGASGGVGGVVFASILLNPTAGVGMFFLPVFIPGWIYAIFYLLYSFFGMKEHRGDVGHDAHLGGAIIGFLITAGLHPAYARANLWIFLTVLISAILLLVYLWKNPLFLPLSTFFQRSSRKTRASNPPRHKRENLQVDAILEKVSRLGINSLTAEEKSLLEEVSGKYQRRSKSEKPRSGLSI